MHSASRLKDKDLFQEFLALKNPPQPSLPFIIAADMDRVKLDLRNKFEEAQHRKEAMARMREQMDFTLQNYDQLVALQRNFADLNQSRTFLKNSEESRHVSLE